MRVLVFLCVMGLAGLYAQSTQVIKIMQDMEYAMNFIERGLIYNKKEWVNEGLTNLKMLSAELQKIDPIAYLDKERRKNTEIVNGIVSQVRENIMTMEKVIGEDEMPWSAEIYGVVLRGCVACHRASRSW